MKHPRLLVPRVEDYRMLEQGDLVAVWWWDHLTYETAAERVSEPGLFEDVGYVQHLVLEKTSTSPPYIVLVRTMCVHPLTGDPVVEEGWEWDKRTIILGDVKSIFILSPQVGDANA